MGIMSSNFAIVEATNTISAQVENLQKLASGLRQHFNELSANDLVKEVVRFRCYLTAAGT